MEKHLLLTVGDDPAEFQAVEFAGRFLAGVPEVKFTILYLTPKPPKVFSEDRDFGRREIEAAEYVRRHRAHGEEMTMLAAKRLMDMGYEPQYLFPKVQATQYDTPQDITYEARQGLYDAVVLGQRGISRLAEVETNSVSRQVFLQELDFPLWVCKGPVTGGKDVLVWFDGGDASFRALDHVGFMLSGLRDRRIVLLHMSRSGEAPLAGVLDAAKKQLAQSGVADAAVEPKVVASGDPAAILAREAEERRYAAVAVGRRQTPSAGEERGLARRIFDLLDDRSIWIC